MTNPPATRPESRCPQCRKPMHAARATFVRSCWTLGDRRIRHGGGTLVHRQCAATFHDSQTAAYELQRTVNQHLQSGFLTRLRVADRVHGLRYLSVVAQEGDAGACRLARRSYWRFLLPRWCGRFFRA